MIMSDTYRDRRQAQRKRDMAPPRPHYLWPVPKWFKDACRREFRARLTQSIRRGDCESLPLDKRDHAYRYW